MRFGTLLSIAGGLGVLFGLTFLLVPVLGLQQYGVVTDPAGLFLAQFFGAALLQLGLVFLCLRNLADSYVPRMAMGACVGELAGLYVAIRMQRTGVVNVMGWTTVAIYGLLALGFAVFAFRKPRAA